MKEKIKQKGIIQIPVVIGILVFIGCSIGIGYGVMEYNKTSKLIEEARNLGEEERYGDAIEKLNLAQVSWLISNLGIKKQEVSDEIKNNNKLIEEKKEYDTALNEFNTGNLEKAIELFSDITENSFYYKDANLKLEESKRLLVEEELSETKIAKKEVEEELGETKIAKEEAEAKAKQEEFERKLKEQQLSEKEAEEKRMSTDNDGDGLSYRRELELGTSDWDTDSDDDGIKDGEDTHPAGGGRYIAQNFEWEYKGTLWSWDYSIQEDWYEYYKNKPRSPHGTEYVTPNDPFIKEIVKALKETSDKKNYHLTSFIVSFVQGLPYVEDYYTSFDEYPKYPIETFIERNGDCEDTSYLFASLVQATNLGASLVEFHNHMGVGVKTVHEQSGYYYPIGDDWYYYYETTGKGWNVGELPEDYLYETAKITRIWDSNVYHLYPQYIKPCDPSTTYSGYYTDGEHYYRDSNCNNRTTCLPSLIDSYRYYDGNDFYWDSNCTQRFVYGCYKSKTYPGYFYKSGQNWYYDSQCIEIYKSMSCDYPSSLNYICTSDVGYDIKKDSCDFYQSYESFQDLAEDCYAELPQCRSDINEYQAKKNAYNQCKERKEY